MPLFEIRLEKEFVKDGHNIIKAVRDDVVSRCEYCERVYWYSRPKCECGRVPLLHKSLSPIKRECSYEELLEDLKMIEAKECGYEVFEIKQISSEEIEELLNPKKPYKEPEREPERKPKKEKVKSKVDIELEKAREELGLAGNKKRKIKSH